MWHVVRGHAGSGWFAGFPALLQMVHIGPPPPLLPLPAPPSARPAPAPTNSATPGRWSVACGLEARGGVEGRCSLPRPSRRSGGGGGVRRSPTPTKVVGGAVRRGGGGDLVPCGQGLVKVLPAQSAQVLEFLQNPFLGVGRRRCVHGAHLVH